MGDAMIDMNKIARAHVTYFPWKGKTFNQITAAIQKNQNSVVLTKYNLHQARPVKHYRKEIASTPLIYPQYQRSLISIDQLNRPNGYIITSQTLDSKINGLVDTIDFNYENNKTQHPGTCNSFSTSGVCLTQDYNAKRRVRTSGIIQNNYYNSTSQYLGSRNRAFEQNQYNYNYSRNTIGRPGGPITLNNIYNPLMNHFDISGCSRIVYYKPNNNQFAQQGATTSSSLITRKKYNTISSDTMKYRTVFGDSLANSIASGIISDQANLLKNIIGFPNICTPIVKADGTVQAKKCLTIKG